MVFILFSFRFPTHGGASAADAGWIKLQMMLAGSERITLSWLFGLSSLLRGRALSPGTASFGPSASALRDEPDVIL